MHSRLSKYLHTKNILVTKQYGFRKGMSAVKMLPSDKLILYSNLLTTKCMMEEFYVIWQRLLIV